MNMNYWERMVLPNGMRVLLFPRMSDMTAQLALGIEYGSNGDSINVAGTAHFLEHMLAGGSGRRIELSREIEGLGGSGDFFTTNELTMGITDIMPGKISRTSHILSKLMLDSFFENEKFDLERKIILNEITEVSDNPFMKINEMLRECLFKTHSIRSPICGHRNIINQLSLDTLVKKHGVHYVPPNMILVLAGRFSEGDVKTVLEDFSEDNGKTASERTFQSEDGEPKKSMVLKRKGLSQTYLSMGLRTDNVRHRDTPIIDLINTLIGVGPSSRLFIELREKRALAYSVTSSHESGIDFGFFHVDCAINRRNLEKTENIIQKEFEKLKTKKISENELWKGKYMIRGEMLRALDSPSVCPQLLAEMEMWFCRKGAISEYLKMVDDVTLEEIYQVANKYLIDENFSTVVLAPSQ
ncbi:MAG: hypothetical protein QG670_1294 [Thermoproteota archaeon]|nr:hypothetical protein [Thermoproteota archaeon]